jgi:hypothetical protein
MKYIEIDKNIYFDYKENKIELLRMNKEGGNKNHTKEGQPKY